MINTHVAEGWIYHGALPTPFVAIGHKNGLSDQRLKGVDHQITFWKRTAIIPQDQPNQFGIIEQHRSPSRITEITHIKTVSSTRQKVQQVTVPIAQHSKQCRQCGQWPWVRWDEGFTETQATFPDDQSVQYGRLN